MKRLLVDLSSIVWTCLRAGKDPEHSYTVTHEDKTVTINSAGYGFDNCLNHFKGIMAELAIQPHQIIFVKEGANAKLARQSIYDGYKRDRSDPPAWYEEFNQCCDMLLGLFLSLGANLCWQDGREGDDVLGYLAKHLDGEIWIDSNDKDMAYCMSFGPHVHHWRGGKRDQNPFGPFDPAWIPAWIAVVGDDKDKIPGAKGFGQKAGEKLLIMYGDDGLEMLDELIRTDSLGRLAEDVPDMKELQKIIDSASMVKISYELARLQVEKVNTLQNPLQWKVGMVKPRTQIAEPLMRHYGGEVKLVHAGNYADAVAFLKKHLHSTPWFALDIETSTPPESDEWLEMQDKEEKAVDVMGSELTGLSITFGPNLQYTYYITHEHVETGKIKNVTLAQVRDMVDLIPRQKITWVHNNAFELPVLYNEWGKDWESDPEYHGFLRNVRDTAIAASYVDENERRGLKALSSRLLQYEQTTFEQVTTKELPEAEWVKAGNPGRLIGHIPAEESGLGGAESFVKVQFKMNQLTAEEVVDYGADDSICTSSLANFFQIIMEIEDTIEVFHEVETWPAYLTALAFVQGADFDLAEMLEMQKEDDQTYAAAEKTLNEFLIKVGFDGTVCPVYEEITPANVKEAHELITGMPLKMGVRNLDKIEKFLNLEADEGKYGDQEDRVRTLATVVGQNRLDLFNELVQRYFQAAPHLDLGSPKQMQKFLYDVVGIPIQIVNDVTKAERIHNRPLADALYRFKKYRMGKASMPDESDMKLVRTKAKTDDTAVDYALAFDADSISSEQKEALHCIQKMKKVMTRRSLFYKNYLRIRHWKTGKIHAQVNQSQAVTRRYSMSNPNLQQLPKKGEGVRFRGCFKPHHKDAVVASIDFSGQELRLAAERSQDKNMLACYIGDQLKDLHSITAAGAMRLKWGNEKVDGLSVQFGSDLPVGLTKQEYEYRLFLKLRDLGKKDPVGKLADDLRKDSKNVNFAAQFGGQAQKLSETLIMRIEDAQLFLDARSAMFPDVDKAAKRAADFVMKHGYALTMMGARRHLRASVLSDDKREVSAAQRQGWNMEIQGSAGEMTKLGMGRLWKSGALFKYDARFVAVVHDELVTSVHRDHAADFLKIKHECMTQKYADMTVPICGSISLGPDFARQIECGDWYIEKNIREAVNEVFNVKEAA